MKRQKFGPPGIRQARFSPLRNCWSGSNINHSQLWDETRVAKPGKLFEVINQSWMKSLDEFDTTWLVVPDGAG